MQRRAQVAAGLVAVAIGAAAVTTSPTAVLSRLAWLTADPFRFGVALLVLAAARPLLAWPTTLLAVAAGYGYGLAGLPLALALIVLTSVPPFYLAKRARTATGGSAGHRLLVGLSDRGERVVSVAGDLRSVVASRLLPAPSDVVSAGAGVSDVSLGAFLLGTALGEIPWAVAGVLAGSSLTSLTAATAPQIDVRLVLGSALLGALLLAEPAYRYVRSRERSEG
jgi:uncharacterized membrane protein YdjX (TVP38/TMEM64 family)